MFEDLLIFEILHEASPEAYCFGGVTMLRDFGPLRKGDKPAVLWFDLDNGIVIEFAANGEDEVQQFKFRLEA